MADTPRQARRAALAARGRIQRDTAAEILRLLELARDRIAATLAAQPSDYTRWRLTQLDVEIRRHIAQMEQGAAGALDAGAQAAWRAGQDLVDAPLRAAGIGAASTGIDRRQLDAMRTFMTGRIKDLSDAAVNRVNQELGLVVIGAQSPQDAIAKVAELLGPQGEPRKRAITIVRTELGRAFSTAAHERLEEAAAKVPGLKKQWRRSGKRHSRPQHDAIDGEVREIAETWEVVDPRTGAVAQLRYPRDPAAPIGETINCGCEVLPWKAEWEVRTPRRKEFSEHELTPQELARNPVKAQYVAARRKKEQAAN